MLKTLQPDDFIAVQMTAVQWNQIMTVMAEAPVPHRMVDPLIRAIQQQCMQYAQADRQYAQAEES